MPICPACIRSAPAALLGRHGLFQLYYCRACGLRYTEPMEEAGPDFYQRSLLYAERQAPLETPAPREDWRYQTALSGMNPFTHPRLLDIGCGDGGFLEKARQLGFVVAGFDADSRAVDYAREKRHLSNVRRGDWRHLEANAGHFDVATLFDVLEHVGRPLALLVELRSFLRPGGQVCITVPRFDRYPRLFDREADFPPHHLTLWSPEAVKIVLQKAGFENVKLRFKALSGEDLQLHASWRFRRLKGAPGPSEPASLPRPTKQLTRAAKKTARFGFQAAAWALRTLALARGHTLLALADRPYERVI